jgi:hypothetical protein
MLKPLAHVVEPGADFFVEDVAITAIVFDTNDDDVTLWITTIFDEELHFFHLAASFADLSTLLRLAGERGPAIDEEVADALSGSANSSEETASATLQEANAETPETTESSDDDEDDDSEADDDEDDDDEAHPTLLEFVSEERPPVLLPAVALKLAFTYTDETDTEAAFNIFALEGIYLQIT